MSDSYLATDLNEADYLNQDLFRIDFSIWNLTWRLYKTVRKVQNKSKCILLYIQSKLNSHKSLGKKDASSNLLVSWRWGIHSNGVIKIQPKPEFVLICHFESHVITYLLALHFKFSADFETSLWVSEYNIRSAVHKRNRS